MPKFCVNPATTMPTDFATDVRAYSSAGFRAMEIWLAKVEKYVDSGQPLSAAALLLKDHGLTAPAACAQGDLLIAADEARAKALDALRRRLDICQSLGCPTLIVPSEPLPQPTPRPVAPLYDLAVENLAAACDIAKPYGVRLALEFIKGPRLLGTPLAARDLARRTGRANAGVLFDTFHFYAGYGKLEDVDALAGGSVFFVHVNDATGDVPREALTDKERVFLGDGVFPLPAIFDKLRRTGYDGYYSLELFSEAVWADDPFAVARRAYANLTEYLGKDEE